MASICGKAIHIWLTSAICKGDVKQITEMVVSAGFETAILHHVNVSGWATAERVALAQSLQSAGVAVWGEGAVYGLDPASEGRIAAAHCKKYGLLAFVFDAEGDWDTRANADSNAVKLLRTFKAGTDALSGWCWWARWKDPRDGSLWHPMRVLRSALDPKYGNCDFGMPMSYWYGKSADTAISMMEQTWDQWRYFIDDYGKVQVIDKPIIPIGRAYIGDDGEATPAAIKAFDEKARSLGAVGVSWWSMQHAIDSVHLPGVWDALAGLPKFNLSTPVPTQPVPVVEDWYTAIDAWARKSGFDGPAAPKVS